MSGAIGRAVGGILSPATFTGSLVRGARLFHPSGLAYRGQVLPAAPPPPAALAPLAAALGVSVGNAVLRFSGAWWKNSLVMRDALGIAVRFRKVGNPLDPTTHPIDQDLLFESFSHLYTLPIAAFTTNSRDYLANTYYAILPFQVAGVGSVKFRLRALPTAPYPLLPDRNQTLEAAIALNVVFLHLEVQLPGSSTWVALLQIHVPPNPDLDTAVPGYSKTLSYNPFQDGAGIVPTGYFNALRGATYLASQLGRHAVGG